MAFLTDRPGAPESRLGNIQLVILAGEGGLGWLPTFPSMMPDHRMRPDLPQWSTYQPLPDPPKKIPPDFPPIFMGPVAAHAVPPGAGMVAFTANTEGFFRRKFKQPNPSEHPDYAHEVPRGVGMIAFQERMILPRPVQHRQPPWAEFPDVAQVVPVGVSHIPFFSFWPFPLPRPDRDLHRRSLQSARIKSRTSPRFIETKA